MTTGDKIRERKTGDTGTVCRTEDRWIWVKLDKYRDIPAYRDNPFGPYVEAELSFITHD